MNNDEKILIAELDEKATKDAIDRADKRLENKLTANQCTVIRLKRVGTHPIDTPQEIKT